MIEVRPIDSSGRDAWREFVDAHPDATFYHRVEWQRVIERSFGHRTYYLTARRGSEVVGVLPLVLVASRTFGAILCSMPFLNFGGVLAADEDARGALIEAARGLLRSTGARFVELRHRHPSPEGLPTKTHKVSMTLDLDPDPDALWNGFKTKLRTEIRKGMKAGFEVRSGREELVRPFYDVLSRGWHSMGTPIYGRSFFDIVLQEFGSSVEITLLSRDGVPVGAAFDGFFRDTVEGMWTYSRREYAADNANYLLYWELIRRSCDRGYATFHLGRSTAGSSAEFFKSKWGAQARPLYWEYLLPAEAPLPDVSPDNPKYRLAIEVWRRLPLAWTRWIGPLVAKNIP